MKKDYREISIKGKAEIYKLEKFIEEICDFYNITNEYFGNILLASTEAANILITIAEIDSGSDLLNPVKLAYNYGFTTDSGLYGGVSADLLVNFEKTVTGFTFKMKFSGQEYFNTKVINLDKEIKKRKMEKELFIVKALADEVTISVNSDAIILTFYISSMNYEKSLTRINQLRNFWIKKTKPINKGNE